MILPLSFSDKMKRDYEIIKGEGFLIPFEPPITWKIVKEASW
jgi:hypothetical protein